MKDKIDIDRLDAIIEAIIKVSRGDFSVQVPVTDNYDQIDALSMGINMMIDDLKLKKETDKENEQIKRLNKELEEAKLKAEESERLKMAFLANMSHEIRTPMNGILGFADLLKSHVLPEEKKLEFIGLIEKSGNRMLDIINDIVDISRIESKLVTKNISTVNINDLLDQQYKFFKPRAKQKELKLSLQKGLPDENAVLETDGQKLNAVLINLVNNAIKYTKAGQVEFGYAIRQNDSQTKLEFYVRDTGIGISKEDQALIFDRFTRSKKADMDAIEGTGLGLAISKAYVEILDGKIWVDSIEGEGSVFYFDVPVAEDSKIYQAVRQVDKTDVVTFDCAGKKILVVEDDPVSGYFLKIALQGLSKNILVARDGQEAVDMFMDNPDLCLILMDISLPRMRGDEAIKIIRKTNTEIPIVAQTAYCMEGDKEHLKAIGCNDFLGKPIKMDLLLKTVQKYMNRGCTRCLKN
ncbi:ATP-binding protein [Maribellus sediminis]|uniref:ATP-binding protein n=1 Tax=Maribellus sediminis TaxID=2696285 RepID=UPI00142FBBAF|nr:ATP-binding protein [Maribellus sediminis]